MQEEFSLIFERQPVMRHGLNEYEISQLTTSQGAHSLSLICRFFLDITPLVALSFFSFFFWPEFLSSAVRN